MGSKPRRQKRAATLRPTPTSVEHATIDATEALAPVADPRSPEGFATAFADAFLYLPEDPDPVDVPASAPSEEAAEPAAATVPEAAPAREPAPAPARRSRAKKGDAADKPAAAPKKPKASGATRGDRRKTVTAATDTPVKAAPRRRKTDTVVAEVPPVVAEPFPVAQSVDTWVDQVLEPTPPAPASDEWVDLVFEPTPPTATSDEWEDLVLEPAKTPLPRPRPTAKAAAKSAPATVKKSTAVPPKAAVRSASAPAGSASSTRWWIVALAVVLVAVLAIANRPQRGHDPVPQGLLGAWTTQFWKYEKQTIEVLPDTVVLTLDAAEEGRFPITQVETADAGRETAVKITYRTSTGDENVLDLLADRDPTTVLRFRAHEGVIWTRPEL